MPLPPNLYCGTSGWSYPHWEGVVYPKSRRRGFHALEFLSRYLDAVEINSTFYQPVRPEIARLWIQKVSGNPRFLFTAKLNRRFTHDRVLDAGEVAQHKDGLWPLLRARKLGAVLLQFPWTFRFTEENREYLIRLRRLFHEFPLVAEMRHSSWMQEEALGTLIDYRIGFCNQDQAFYTKAMPATAFLTSDVGYVRLHGRNPRDWEQEFGRSPKSTAAHDYLYEAAELAAWSERLETIRPFSARTFVFTNNDARGKAVVNALQLAAMQGDERRRAPRELLASYTLALQGFRDSGPWQPLLFDRAVA